MTTAEFLAQLRDAKVRVWANGGRVVCSAPEGTLTPALRQELERRKPEILALLEDQAGSEDGWARLRPGPRPPAVPLSFAQRRLWFLDRLQPGTSAFTIGARYLLPGRVDEDAIARAFTTLVQRHEVLRTTFADRDGEPFQVIGDASSECLRIIRLENVAPADRQRVARVIADEEMRRPFDLARGPLFRPVLLEFGPEDHELLFSAHHIIADGWSLEIIAREVTALYSAYVQGRPSPLPDLPIQYADFAIWQRQWLQGDVVDRHVGYWTKQLAGAPATLELPADRPRPPMPGYRGARLVIGETGVGPETVARLQRLAREEGCTLFMVLLAAFQVLLARYTGETDVVVGSPIAGRTHPETEHLVGFFVNTLVLRTDVSGSRSFRELLKRVRDVALGAYAHQDLPFERLVEAVRPRRSLNQSPIFQVMLAFQNVPTHTPSNVTRLELGAGSAQFDLTVHVFDRADGLTAEAEYDTELFDEWRIDRMIRHFHALLESIADDPDREVALLPLLTDTDRDQLLARWNDTVAATEMDRCVHEVFEARAARTPDAVAVSFGDETLTYAELNRRANQLARHLVGLGVGRGDLVGICVERSLEMVVAVLGALKAGAAYVPLDPGYPRERLAFMVEDGGMGVLLTQERVRDRAAAGGARLVCLDTDWDVIARNPGDDLRRDVRPDDLMYVIYTSGSTGRPKGVEVPHRGAVNVLQAFAAEFGFTEHDVLLAITTLSFDIAVLDLFLPLLHGARLEVVDGLVVADGAALAALVAETGATFMQATPTTWRMLVHAGWKGSPGMQILCGGEAVSRELADQLLARAARVWNGYGPTEATIYSTLHRVEPGSDPIPIGRPVPNTDVYVLDDRRQPAPIGVPGELYIGGVGVARGYHNRPDLTESRFVPHPFRPHTGARLYRTGDRVRYRPDGVLEFLGRLDDQVKVRGFRIELAEIELVLRQHPGIREAAVVVHHSDAGDASLVAFVVPAASPAPSAQALRDWVRATLPPYMVPSRIGVLERLPTTPNGKVDRRSLVGHAVHEPSADVDVEPREMPRRPLEIALAEIWREMLGAERVGLYDNFFDVGGHSLLCMRVIARIEERLGVRFSPVDFMVQNLGQLATACEERLAVARPLAPSGAGIRKRIRNLFRLGGIIPGS